MYSTKGLDGLHSWVSERRHDLSSLDLEKIYQVQARIQYLHSLRHPSPAAPARTALESSIKEFPNNTQFLSLYLWGELKGRVYGRLQRLGMDLARNQKSGIVGTLWLVWAEATSAHRSFWHGGAERVRAALDTGINSEQVSSLRISSALR
jgi:hypothetical protein